MRKLVNILKFKIAPILLSVLVFAFLPLHSLTVEASSIALPSSLGVGYDLYSVYQLFNLVNGVSTPSVEQLPSYDELMEAGFTQEQYDSLTSVQFDSMNGFSSGLGDKIRQAISNAVSIGRLILSQDTINTYKEYLAYTGASEVGDSVSVASTSVSVPIYDPGTTVLQWNTKYYNSTYQESCVYNLTYTQPHIFISLMTSSGQRVYSFSRPPVYPSGSVSSGRLGSVQTTSTVFSLVTSEGVSFSSKGHLFLLTADSGSGFYTSYFNIGATPAYLSSMTELADLVYSFQTTGVASYDQSVDGSLVSSGEDVLSSSSQVSDDGTLTGGLSVAVPDFSFLQQILDNLANGVTDFSEAIVSLGLASVSSDSSVAEKEDALSSVADVVTSVLTIQEAGQTTVDQATNELAESITSVETAEDTFRPYYDPDSEDQDYVPNWFFNLPDLANPEDDDSDENHLVEIVSALPVVTGLITDLFDASGPLTLLFYIGITFVLFSVLVGMAHFIGSYGDRRALTSSPKALPASPNVPLLTRKKGR